MTVQNVLTLKGARIVTAKPTNSVFQIADLLRTERIGVVVISSDGVTVEGILSERDIVRAIADNGPAALDLTADNVMTHDVITCERSESVNSVMAKMNSGGFRHLPVVEDGKMCGMISSTDVVRYRLAQAEFEAEHLRSYITQ